MNKEESPPSGQKEKKSRSPHFLTMSGGKKKRKGKKLAATDRFVVAPSLFFCQRTKGRKKHRVLGRSGEAEPERCVFFLRDISPAKHVLTASPCCPSPFLSFLMITSAMMGGFGHACQRLPKNINDDGSVSIFLIAAD